MNQPNTDLLREILGQAQAAAGATMPEFIPEKSPFDREQRLFLNGLFAGVYALAQGAGRDAVEPEQTPLSVLFGSQTGTAESLSKDLRKFAKTRGFDARIAELDSIAPADLASLQHLLIVASTSGEGEPTDNARRFHAALMAADAPPLPATLNYSVCGLGDSSYAHFNRVSRELDARLEQLGATRAAPLIACDVDYDDDYAAWRESVFASAVFCSAAGADTAAVAEDCAAPARFDKNHPFLSTLIHRSSLNGPGSAKTVNHIELSLAGSGEDLDYEVGDALGVWALNDMAQVDAILDSAGLSGREVVTLKSGAVTLRQALLRTLDLVTLTPGTAEAWGVSAGRDVHLIDVLGEVELTAQALVDGLRALQPRLYSIASSPKQHPGEVHLTVSELHYTLNGRLRHGLASNFLGSRLAPGGAVGVYVQRAAHFHLPADDATPLIMIGPGTGIAPFRAFLEERESRSATGRNWLFFGAQHAATDYLYREQLEAWSQSGLLAKLSLAWSRDSEHKVYVQHVIQEAGAEFFRWLEDGAAIYICGDATRMAADVEQAILAVIAEHGALDAAAASHYLDQLRAAQRYQRDVY